MSSTFGNNIKVSIFGQSHSEAIGVVIDGLPANHKIDLAEIGAFMARRAPGQNSVSTPRKEPDIPRIVSGLVDGVTCGAPLCAIIENTNVRSGDYEKLKDVPRPAHADFAARIKHGGANDVRGGGHFSARLTAPLCFAGAVCLQLLKEKNIYIGAHICSIANVKDRLFDSVNLGAADLTRLASRERPLLTPELWQEMEKAVTDARADQDSVGGIIECGIVGLPVGIGEPMFGGMENRISQAIFAVPAVKGIEFGNGFECAALRGSQNNDAFYYDGDRIRTKTNNHGGILGGLSSGMPVIFRAAFKPTPSIAQSQQSVSFSQKQDTELVIQGRHDPCVVLRAVPCVEAAAALAVYDMVLDSNNGNLFA